MNQLPQSGLVRLAAILGNPARGIAPLYPVGRTTWHEGVKSGRFPKPIRIGERAVAWRVEDIRSLIQTGVTG